MPNEHGKSIDKTYLSINNAEQRLFVHRDYLAHCLRWSHVVKFMQERQRYKEASILDIGCGKEAPLLKTLYTSRMLPASYTGVDYGSIEIFQEIPALQKYEDRILLFQHTNFLNTVHTGINFDIIVMFEVLEHVEKSDGKRLLEHVKSFMSPETVLFMSTPCYDGANKAANHVYEWGYEELYGCLMLNNYKVIDVWGTFASLKDYVNTKEFTDFGLAKIFTYLRAYYDVNLLSVIFAPLFPQYSRNCLWQLTL